ncbi:MAG: TetR/AcrR family transcriptional regulator [Rhizobiales bacterium]|nr:TetR/AcrR family transcriptional regulator [Hyphomicrobiales bacterium]
MMEDLASDACVGGLAQVKTSRADKREKTRKSLLQAAIEIVGEEGYAAASISRITSRANVALGTFYNYFDNQQSLFGQLLPFMDDQLTAHIRAEVSDSSASAAFDRAHFIAYVEFCRNTPAFLRVLDEAKVTTMLEGYLRSLERSVSKQETLSFTSEKLPSIAFVLMGIRHYAAMLHQYRYMEHSALSLEATADIYEKFLMCGILNDKQSN